MKEIYDSFKENDTLFNIDLRENPGFSEKTARMFALKMLANYTRISNEYYKDFKILKEEAEYFNPKLLLVEIP